MGQKIEQFWQILRQCSISALPCTMSESKKLGLNQMEKRGQSGACEWLEWAKLSTLFPSLIGWNSSSQTLNSHCSV